MVADSYAPPSLIGPIGHWLRNDCADQLDDMAARVNPAAEPPLSNYALTLSLQSLLDYVNEVEEKGNPEKILAAFNNTPVEDPDENPLTLFVAEAVTDYLENEHDIDIDENDGWRICWTDPPESRMISPRDDTADKAGEQVAVRGRIVHATKPKTLFEQIAFQCQRCGTHKVVPQKIGKDEIDKPLECPGCERQGPFTIVEHHDDTKRISTQYLRIEEVLGDQDSQSTPEDIDVRVYSASRTSQDWKRGEVVEVVGRVAMDTRSLPAESYIIASSVEPEDDRDDEIEVTPEDRERIKEIIDEHGVLDAAADSLAPEIYGHHLAKQGLFLAMVGHDIGDKPDLNVGLWGEPGTGKSELLKEIADLHPKGRAIDASNSSFVGITAAVEHEEIAGDTRWVVHPGAIPRTSGGIVTMDELDKVDYNPSKLTDILWKNEITVDKSALSANLRTDVGVIAAANPDDDTLDPTADLPEQFTRFEKHLLDRFPLAYPSKRDLTDTERQRGIADRTAIEYIDEDELDEDDTEFVIDPVVDRELLRKWIYAAWQQETRMTLKANRYIRDTFLEFRQDHAASEGKGIDIGNRRYDAVFWLAHAHARARLSETVELEDAKAAVHHMIQMLGQWGYNVEGESPFADTEESDDDDGNGDPSDADEAVPAEAADDGDQNREWSLEDNVYRDDITDADISDQIVARVEDYIADHPEAGVEDVLDACDLHPEFSPWVSRKLRDRDRDHDGDDSRDEADDADGYDPSALGNRLAHPVDYDDTASTTNGHTENGHDVDIDPDEELDDLADAIRDYALSMDDVTVSDALEQYGLDESDRPAVEAVFAEVTAGDTA